jgi:lysophospholipase L1-like esterase
MKPVKHARWVEIGLACGVIVVSLLALDRIVAWFDLGYAAARGRPSEDRRLTRAEFDVRVVTNRLGFREPRLPEPKAPGERRIVVLGDSFTQGYGVAEEQAYPRVLERLLDGVDPAHRVSVVNLGVPGTSPRDYLGHLEDPGLAYAPDLVLVGVMGNDVQDVWFQHRFGVRFAAEVLRDVQRDLTDDRPLWRRLPERALPALYPLVWTQLAALRPSLTASAGTAHAAATNPAAERAGLVPDDRWRDVVLTMGERFGRGPETARALERVPAARRDAIARVATGRVTLDSEEGVTGYLDLLGVLEPRLFADAVLLPPAYDAAWHATEGYLRAMTRLAERAGSRIAFVYIPASHQVTTAARAAIEASGFTWDPRTLEDTTFPDRLRALGKTLNVPVVDLMPACRAAPDPAALYFARDGHWTAAGHALAARELARATPSLLAGSP